MEKKKIEITLKPDGTCEAAKTAVVFDCERHALELVATYPEIYRDRDLGVCVSDRVRCSAAKTADGKLIAEIPRLERGVTAIGFCAAKSEDNKLVQCVKWQSIELKAK